MTDTRRLYRLDGPGIASAVGRNDDEWIDPGLPPRQAKPSRPGRRPAGSSRDGSARAPQGAGGAPRRKHRPGLDLRPPSSRARRGGLTPWRGRVHWRPVGPVAPRQTNEVSAEWRSCAGDSLLRDPLAAGAMRTSPFRRERSRSNDSTSITTRRSGTARDARHHKPASTTRPRRVL